jgi:hypothetical protein
VCEGKTHSIDVYIPTETNPEGLLRFQRQYALSIRIHRFLSTYSLVQCGSSHPLPPLSHLLTLTLTYSLSLTLTHSHSFSLTLTHSHSLSLTLTHSHFSYLLAPHPTRLLRAFFSGVHLPLPSFLFSHISRVPTNSYVSASTMMAEGGREGGNGIEDEKILVGREGKRQWPLVVFSPGCLRRHSFSLSQIYTTSFYVTHFLAIIFCFALCRFYFLTNSRRPLFFPGFARLLWRRNVFVWMCSSHLSSH